MENTFLLCWKLLPPKVYYWQDYLFPLTLWILNQINSKLTATWVFVFTFAIKSIAYAYSAIIFQVNLENFK